MGCGFLKTFMVSQKSIDLGSTGFPDIYRGSERRRFGDTSIIDQILILKFLIKKTKFNQEQVKWKFNILSKLHSKKKKKPRKINNYIFNPEKKKHGTTEKT